MKKILLSLLLASGVNNSFAMQAGAMQSLGSAAPGGAAGSASAAKADHSLSSFDQALFSAVRSGDLENVKELLVNGADVDAKNAKGCTALIVAAAKGHVETVQALLVEGAAVEAKNAKECTALIVAAAKGHVEIVQALLDAGADVDAKSAKGATALQSAKGATALMIAAKQGHPKVVQTLIENRANVNAQNQKKWTSLIRAAQNGHAEVVQALLNACANVNAQNDKGWTALMIAAHNGHVEVVRQLLDAGANVDVACSKNKTAIDYASDKPEIIRLFTIPKASQAAQVACAEPAPSKAAAAKDKKNAAAGGGVQNSFVMQAGVSAAQGGAAGSASAATADNNLSPVDKALFDAVRSGDLENAKARLANVANVNVQNAKGGTALMLAAANGHVDVVRKLLEEGVNVNARNKNSRTALMFAAQNGHVEVVRQLLDAGANVDLKNKDSRTALITATFYKRIDVIKLLQQHKASQVAQAASAKTVPSKAAAAKGKGKAAAGGGVTRAGGGAASQPADNPKLCTAVAAEILNKDADKQTDERVQILPSGAQQRLASRLESAFTRQEKVTSADQPSCEIMIPVASRSQVFALAGMQQAMAMPVETQMSLQTLIENTSNTTRGLFELCDKLRLYQSTKFSAQEAVALFECLGFDTKDLYCQSSDGAIAGNQLAVLLGNKFIAFCGGTDHTVPQIKLARDSLNQCFAQYAQGKLAAGQITNGGTASQPAVKAKLCTGVAAHILQNSLEQTGKPVQILPSGSQKRSASSLSSAFTRLEKGASTEQPSLEIMRPVAIRPQGFALTGMQQAMAMPVASQIPLKHLIAEASRTGTGLFGLIELLASCDEVTTTINAHEAECLLQTLGFDAKVFVQAHYAPINGPALAQLLDVNINLLFNRSDETVDLTPVQERTIDLLFAKVVSIYFS